MKRQTLRGMRKELVASRREAQHQWEENVSLRKENARLREDNNTRQKVIETYETLLINYAMNVIRVQTDSKNFELTATK